MKRFSIIAAVMVLACLMGSVVAAQTPVDQMPTLSEKEQSLLQELNNPELSKRVKAAQELCERGVLQAVDPLINMMQTDEAFQARIVAACALYELGDKKAFDAIKEQAENDPRQTVRTALRGICQKIDQAS